MARPSDLQRSILSYKIREFRTSLGKTQEQFAAQLGVSSVSVARYETNHVPSAPVLRRLGESAKEHGREKLAQLFRIYELTEPKHVNGIEVMRRVLRTAANSDTDSKVRLAAALTLLGASPEDERKLREIELILKDKLATLDLAASEIWRVESGSDE